MEDSIVKNINEWVKKHLSDDFKFREHQLETIHDIIYKVINDISQTQIIEAPTGSGKSLIFIIASGVLAEKYKKTSYILCSDLYLFSQYENFILDNKIEFGYLKGQTGNYYCEGNSEDVRNGECRMAKIPWAKLMDPKSARLEGFPCATRCRYIEHRRKAMRSKVTLMTYQLYFYMINIVGSSCKDDNGNSTAPFKQRDVIFCDECHNIPSLVQSQYSPVIHKHYIDKLKDIYEYNSRLHIGLFAETEIINLQDIWEDVYKLENEYDSIWREFCDENASAEEDLSNINKYVDFIHRFNSTVECLEDAIAIKKKSTRHLSKEDIKMYKVASWYRNHCCFISDFSTAVNDCGSKYIVKQVNTKNNEDGSVEIVVTLSCAKEDYMCYKYLLSTSPHQVLTSATVGLKEAFEDNIGMKFMEKHESDMSIIPSTFDFSNSPIIVAGQWKMSYDQKMISFPKIRDMIYAIIEQFKGKRGMVQTGSYDIAKQIYDWAPANIKSRLQLYNSSKEKNWVIEMHKATDDSVIIGPTLIEGVDLPGDLLRFIIIAKVPYPNLKDKLVCAKKELFPEWYNSETANSIIQGIGRGNRSIDDWCVTYILDRCFDYLYFKTKRQFPSELQNRIKMI